MVNQHEQPIFRAVKDPKRGKNMPILKEDLSIADKK